MSGIGVTNDFDLSAADSVTTVFTYTFFAYDASQVKIYSVLNDVETPITSGFTVTPNSDFVGGTVTFSTAPLAAVGDILRRREVPYTQTTEFTDIIRYKETGLEKALNTLVMQIQQLASKVSRSMRYSEAAGTTETIIEAPIDGKALIFDGTTGRLIAGPDAADIASVQTYAANALSSKNAAAVSETNAANSAAAAQASAVGMRWRPPVRVATTGNITLSGTQTIDGVGVVVGDRVLVKDQSTASQNGVYIVASGAWARAADADTYEELISQVIVVEEGSVSADKLFICTINSGGTLGVTSITWAELSIAIADGSIGFAKLSSGDIATSANIFAGATNKIATAAAIKTVLGSVMHIQDQKASGTSAGTFTAGAWQTRTLNTAVINTITGASLASNQITLPAGTYKINCTLPALSVDQHQARLQNITDGTTTLLSGCFRSWSSSADSTPADFFGIFTIASTKVFEVQHRCSVTRAADGFGTAASFGTEVYANVFIEMV